MTRTGGVGTVAANQRVEPVAPAAFATRAGNREHPRADSDLAKDADVTHACGGRRSFSLAA